jgi:ubiquitin carboxyl-terminal hydrolase 4/11/15
VPAKKQLEIWSVPPVFVVHLNRFARTGAFPFKLNTAVSFPEILDMAPFVYGPQGGESLLYHLRAVMEHSGGIGGGHYVTHARIHERDWFAFNDATITQSSIARATKAQAYVLCYERIGDTAPSDCPVAIPEDDGSDFDD